MADEENLQHHDIAVMPNGNILAVVWHSKTPAEAEAAGWIIGQDGMEITL